MTRREFVRFSGVGLVAVLARPGFAAIGADRPNLLIIHTDEHNFRTLGCYRKLMPPDQAMIWGATARVETPNIDSIAERGAVCTRFYATSPVCSPSRGAFVSGLYPQNSPVVTNDTPLNDSVVSFAELLRRRGYATGYAGKWHLDGPGKPQWAPKRRFGFDDNRYMYNRGHWKQLEDTPDGPAVKARDTKGHPTYNCKGADEKSFTTDFLADRTVQFITAHKNQPFCFMVSIPDPHGPNTVRAPYDTMFANMKFAPPRTMSKSPEGNPIWARKVVKSFHPDLLAKYFGMVKCIDDNVGKILNALRANGLLEKTIVIFTSDHGDLCYEHARHNKGVPLEASARIPFVIAYPGAITPGTTVAQAMATVDFLPTILGLMGVETTGREEGHDYSALLRKTPAVEVADTPCFVRACAPNTSQTAWLAAVDRRHKMVLCNACDPWLLDHQTDPDELVNQFLNPEYRDVVRRLGVAMLTYAREHRDPFANLPYLKHDLTWAAEGRGPYTAPDRGAALKGSKDGDRDE